MAKIAAVVAVAVVVIVEVAVVVVAVDFVDVKGRLFVVHCRISRAQ